MAGGKIIKFTAGLSGLFQKKSELEFLVANHARVWGFTFQVFISEVIDDMVFIFLSQIDCLKRNLEFLANGSRRFNIFFLPGAVTGMFGRFIKMNGSVINFHGDPVNFKILLAQ